MGYICVLLCMDVEVIYIYIYIYIYIIRFMIIPSCSYQLICIYKDELISDVSKDELINDVLLWTPAYGQAKARRPARTYIQQLCEDTGCSPEDQPEAMNDREK